MAKIPPKIPNQTKAKASQSRDLILCVIYYISSVICPSSGVLSYGKTVIVKGSILDETQELILVTKLLTFHYLPDSKYEF